jgi:tripartite-type tricarboxylate transporter receptor subunit TctC
VDDAPAAYAKGNIKVDPTTDMLPVAVVQITFSQLYIRNTETRFSDWAEFLRYAREHPGELTVSLVGHEDAMEALLLEMLTREAGIQVAHESYNKPSERYLSLVRGKVDALIEQPGDVRVFLDSRMIKPILTLLPEPHPAFPDAAGLNSVEEELPTLHRARMFFAHGDLPKAKLAYLEWALKKAYDSNGFRAFNEDHYMNLIDSYRDIDGGKKFVGDMISTFKKINGQ